VLRRRVGNAAQKESLDPTDATGAEDEQVGARGPDRREQLGQRDALSDFAPGAPARASEELRGPVDVVSGGAHAPGAKLRRSTLEAGTDGAGEQCQGRQMRGLDDAKHRRTPPGRWRETGNEGRGPS